MGLHRVPTSPIHGMGGGGEGHSGAFARTLPGKDDCSSPSAGWSCSQRAATPISRKKSEKLARAVTSICMGALPQPLSSSACAAVARAAGGALASSTISRSTPMAWAVCCRARKVTVWPSGRPARSKTEPGYSRPSSSRSASLSTLRRSMLAGLRGSSLGNVVTACEIGRLCVFMQQLSRLRQHSQSEFKDLNENVYKINGSGVQSRCPKAPGSRSVSCNQQSARHLFLLVFVLVCRRIQLDKLL